MIKELESGHSNGEVLKSFDTAGFILNEVAYPAMSKLLAHSHANAHFCFVLQGAYTEKHGKQKNECKPSTLTFRPPGEVHEDEFHNQDVRVFTIEILPKRIESLQQNSIKLTRFVNFEGGSITRLSERLVREFYRMDTAAGLVIEGLTLEILAETVRHSEQNLERTTPYWLKQAKELIRSRFTENLTLEQIAMEVGVHPVHLATVFRQKYQCTIGEYIRSMRIDYACREIEKGKTPLAIIALEAGFANQGHFSNTFKRLKGFTPASYRNSIG